MGDEAPDREPMDLLTRILEQLTVAHTAPPRIRFINCKSYKIGEDWGTFEAYFRENVRAAHQFAPTEKRNLDNACCSWIGSKLEPGPTLTAYQNLDDATKTNWDDLKMELGNLYCNEEEKQLFLANPGGFKKGNMTFMEYKNELVRLVNLYQPKLQRVEDEYQRQLVTRFIEGIEDSTLQRKLRFHCKRLLQNIDAAYQYAVDYESCEAETKAQDLAASSTSTIAAAVPVSWQSLAEETHLTQSYLDEDQRITRLETELEKVQTGLAQTNENVAALKRTVETGFEEIRQLFAADNVRQEQEQHDAIGGQMRIQPQHYAARALPPVIAGMQGQPPWLGQYPPRSPRPAHPVFDPYQNAFPHGAHQTFFRGPRPPHHQHYH